MKRIPFVLGALAAMASANAILATSFEDPPYMGTAAGVDLTGQDGWETPAGSNFWLCYDYAGNAAGYPTAPAGGAQFIAGEALAGNIFGRAQHPVDFSMGDIWSASFYIAAKYRGTLPTAPNLGSFSQQPSATSQFWQTLYNFVDVATATNWNCWYLCFDAGGVQFAQPGVSPGAAWDGLAVDHWYRCHTTWNYATHLVEMVAISDLSTGVTTVARPVGYYLAGGAASTLPRPTAIRNFSGGAAGNNTAIDCQIVTNGAYLVASDAAVSRGVHQSGDVVSTYEKDTNVIMVQQRPQFAPTFNNAEVTMNYTGRLTVNSINVKVCASCSGLPSDRLELTIAMFNYVTNRFEVVLTTAPSTAETMYSVDITTDPNRFVEANTGNVRVRFGVRDVRGALIPNWGIKINSANVTEL